MAQISPVVNMLESARELQPELVAIRRHLHKHPELSFEERETARFVAEKLRALGFVVRENVGGTGVVGEIGEGKTAIIRADMDALPIEESQNREYCSEATGVMHACGHDAHTTCALGAAMLISKNPPKNGRVRFMFQPAEETVDADGKSGATHMIEAGATSNGECVIALHVDPRIPAGSVAFKEGPLLAACDSFNITVKGVGTHGAYPQYGVDAIVLAAHVVQALQTVISRRKSALEPAILTVGGIRSKTYRSNIVAEEVELTGTVRHFSEALSQLIREEITRACRIVEPMGGSFNLEYTYDTPPLVNDPALVDLVRQVGRTMLGDERVRTMSMETGGDDFAFLSKHMPGCYFALGVRIEGSPRMLHTPEFDINEDALPIGSAMLAQSALTYLAQ